jgi:Na+/H+ antiporter NhaD/arsenite permease-like protein
MSDHAASHDDHHSSGSGRGVTTVIGAIVLAYLAAAGFGWPQYGTQMVVEHSSHAEDSDHHEHHGEEVDGAHPQEAGHEVAPAPAFWTVIPFVLLLGAIAVLPLIPATEHWWDSNANRFLVAVVLAVVTLLYYGLMHNAPVDGHWPVHTVAKPDSGGFNTDIVLAVLGSAILGEFIPFIVLLFSLYTICGGIRISGDLRATPFTNMAFMAAGAVGASFVGTTGAAMLLIRPLLETNRERAHVKHTVVFFIFIVCNCGGCLLPIGDPPLFLGYLQGVSFLWTLEALWQPWLLTNGVLLVLYFLVDQLWFYRKESVADIYRDQTHTTRLTFQGLALNLPLLLGVVLAVALLDPSKAFPGTDFHPWMYSREIVQLTLVACSLLLGSTAVRRSNAFNYHAIVEVAALFSGIFICMQPALQILNVHGPELGKMVGAADGELTPTHYYWFTGGLSSVLDNAPTYLVFFKTAEASNSGAGTLVPGTGVNHQDLVAISLGAVFLGAMTYIGNGPNFMVRAIAEKSGVKMPSFFGYVAYSVLFLLPFCS